jgi:putative aldouronate transport system permease protein
MGVRGIWASPWVGLKHFWRFIDSYYFARIVTNTLGINLYQLLAGFPFPILLAISLNEVKRRHFRNTVQMITYMPHFISTVVLVAMVFQFLNPRIGFISLALRNIGIEMGYVLGDPKLFKTIYVFSGIWQNMGYSSIIYIAALSAIDPQLHEAAIVDGATRIQRIRHIDLPGILPTAIILFILQVGHMMNVGFEKVYLMQNSLNLTSSEIIATYVYKVGLVQADYSYAAMIGLFNSVINLCLLLISNRIARKLTGTSLW